MLLSHLITEHLVTLEVLNRSAGTIYNHKYYSQHLTDQLKQNNIASPSLEDITPLHIKSMLLYWRDDLHWSPTTINKTSSTLKSMFNYAVEENYMDTSPFQRIKKMKEPQTIIKTFSKTPIHPQVLFTP